MLLEKLESPITLMNTAQYGINIKTMQDHLREAYSEYEWDKYLLGQNKIELIRGSISPELFASIPNTIWMELYQQFISDSNIPSIFPQNVILSSELMAELKSLKPTRKRCISAYDLYWNEKWMIERTSSPTYEQNYALIASETDLDFRMWPRSFKELSDELFDDNLRRLITAVADQVRYTKPTVRKLHIITHHVVMYCYPQQVSTNSPEGIHQDGMDFIVSALVVERDNINGGTSIVYGADRKTKIFQVELQAGQGIFHPDVGTDIWHEVTPIEARNQEMTGYRSTIGFDVIISSLG